LRLTPSRFASSKSSACKVLGTLTVSCFLKLSPPLPYNRYYIRIHIQCQVTTLILCRTLPAYLSDAQTPHFDPADPHSYHARLLERIQSHQRPKSKGGVTPPSALEPVSEDPPIYATHFLKPFACHVGLDGHIDSGPYLVSD